MVANYPRSTGYAWWFMNALWNNVELAAEAVGWRAVIAYPPDDSAEGKALDSVEAFLSRGTAADLSAINRLLKQQNVRSLYLTDRSFRSWKYVALRAAGVRCIVVHDHTPGDRPPIGGLKGFAKRAVNEVPGLTADLCVSISPLMRDRHIYNARLPAERCVTVTNGIAPEAPIAGAREALLETYGLAPDTFIVGSVGRLNPYKRYDVAIEGIERLNRQHPSLNPILLLVGDGPDRERLIDLAESLNVAERIRFVGEVDDVWPILCGLDGFLHTSQGEGLSLAILEAMAASKPVVVPDIPTVSQTIRDGVDGIVYPDSDRQTMVDALARLAAEPELRATMGRSAREQVLERYTLEQTFAQFRARVIDPLLLSALSTDKTAGYVSNSRP